MSLTIRVLSDDGWQNGDKLYPKNKVFQLNHSQKEIQPYIDEGVLEIVIPEVVEEPEDENQKRKDDIEFVTKAVVIAMKDFIPKGPKFEVQDLAEDDPKGGFSCMAEFAKSVYDVGQNPGGNTAIHKKMRIWQKMTADKSKDSWQEKTTGHMAEVDPEQGGYLVPTEFSASLLQRSLEKSVVRPLARFIPMNTNSIQMPGLVDYDHRPAGDGLFGALQIKRPAEAGPKNPSKPKFERIQLTLHKTVLLTYVSDELLEDSPISIEPMINDLFGQAIAFQEDNDFINGTGANMPLGIMNSGCLITRTRSGCGISYLDLVNMWSSMYAGGHQQAVWLVAPSTLPDLMTACVSCKDSDCSDITTSHTPVYVGGDPANAAVSPYGTIFGRPVIITEHCQAPRVAGDIILADFSQYLIGGKAGRNSPAMDKSIHLKFDYDEVAFRAVLRYDGQPHWSEPLTPKHPTGGTDNTNELSPFIILSTQ